MAPPAATSHEDATVDCPSRLINLRYRLNSSQKDLISRLLVTNEALGGLQAGGSNSVFREVSKGAARRQEAYAYQFAELYGI